jgi:hypothetical protein
VIFCLLHHITCGDIVSIEHATRRRLGKQDGSKNWNSAERDRQRFISGARVAFDPRTTAEVISTRDSNNYKANEKPLRTAQWELRQAEDRAFRRRYGLIGDHAK